MSVEIRRRECFSVSNYTLGAVGSFCCARRLRSFIFVFFPRYLSTVEVKFRTRPERGQAVARKEYGHTVELNGRPRLEKRLMRAYKTPLWFADARVCVDSSAVNAPAGTENRVLHVTNFASV